MDAKEKQLRNTLWSRYGKLAAEVRDTTRRITEVPLTMRTADLVEQECERLVDRVLKIVEDQKLKVTK